MLTVSLLADSIGSTTRIDAIHSLMDQSWVLLSAAMVLLMQAGFLCLESGLSRAKNSIHIAVKNLADFCVSVALFWSVGYALMFGISRDGLIGLSEFFYGNDAGSSGLTFFLFQATFCGAATTIVSVAVAERMRFTGYMAIAGIVSGIIYPVYGHWAWGGAAGGDPGWLASIGFIDFAGSSVVHSVGGWVALAAALIIGPRIGRFGANAAPINGSNLPLAMLGVLLLWFGWFGFNGGSTLAVNEQIPLILVNTSIAAGMGGFSAMLVSRALLGKSVASDMMNGVLAGLVGVTAGCHVLTPAGSAIVGIVASLICFAAVRLLSRLRIDDTISAFPVHGVAGAWGTLAVALLADPSRFGTGLNRWEQFSVQAMGVAACFVWAFGGGLALVWVINKMMPLRVPAEDEISGLNVVEHGASTELIDLLSHMQRQGTSGEFDSRVPVEPNTEIGQIAVGYNEVLDRVNEKTESLEKARAEAEELNLQLVDAAHNAGKAEIATEVLHNVGNVLNSINVSAGLVMERVDDSRSDLLRQVAGLIEQNYDDPADFFAEGSRGRKVPGFLEEVADAMEKDQEHAVTELRTLMENLDHIKAIVSTQQSYAGLSGLQEPVDIKQLITEAETLNASSFGRHSVDIRYDIPPLPEALLEKQKVLQILVNLLKNAKEALVSCRVEGRQINVTVRQQDDEMFVIEVADNGSGISPENLKKIFNHGFTTKDDGHGFGLHSCANAAKQMGGSLRAESEGIGRGATFVLELPFIPVEVAV